MQYILISVAERNIDEPRFFNTKEEAHDVMCADLASVLDVPLEEIRDSYRTAVFLNGDTWVFEDGAWTERFGMNFDWKIFCI